MLYFLRLLHMNQQTFLSTGYYGNIQKKQENVSALVFIYIVFYYYVFYFGWILAEALILYLCI